MKFDLQTIQALLQAYYENYEHKNVQVNIKTGKIITRESFLPKRSAITFEVIEPEIERTGVEKRTLLNDEELLHDIRLVLKDFNFYVTTIELTIDQNTNLPIFKVNGNKIHTKTL